MIENRRNSSRNERHAMESLMAKRAASGFVLVLLVLLGNALVAYFSMRNLVQNNERVTHSYEVLVGLQKVFSDVQDVETAQRGFVITGEERYLGPHDAAMARLGGETAKLRSLIEAKQVSVLLPTLESAVQQRLAISRRVIEARRRQGFAPASQLIRSGQGKTQMDRIRRLVSSMTTLETDLLRQREDQSRASARRAALMLSIAAAVNLILLSLVYFVSGRFVAQSRRAAADLKAGHDRFRSIVNATSQIIWTRDTNGDFVDEQPSWSAFTGQKFEELRGNRWLEALHPEDRERVMNSWQKVLRGGDAYEVEYHLRRSDGEYRNMLVRAAPVREQDGAVREWVGTSTDITEKKQSEQQLHESETRKTAVLETALDCIIAIDSDSLVTEFNPAAEKTFGYTREEAIGRCLPELIITPELREAHFKGMARYLETGEGPVLGQRIEVPAMRADGSTITVELAITRIPVDGPPSFTAYLRDITERKHNEESLAAHARLASLTAEVGLALTQSDSLRGILQRCSEALVKHLDAAFARVWTLNDADNVLELQASAGLYTHIDGPHGRVPVGQFKIGLIAQENKPHLTNEVVGDPRVGDQEWAKREGMVAFAGYPMVVEGQMIGVLAMFARHALSDEVLRTLATVSDAIALGVKRKRAEEDLEKARHAAETANRTKSLFLANMSHELRTPLNAILGYSEMLREEAQEQKMEEFSSDLEKINTAGKHLLSLINDILDLSKIEAGKMEMYLEDFDVAEMIHGVTSTIEPLIAKNANTLTVECAPDLGIMHADLTKVRQALYNLFSNAAKFTHEGSIRLEASRQRMDGSDWLVFRLEDTGIGMAPDEMVKLFQTFTQADASTTRKFGGTGLGLALTRSFCQMMGGDVTVHSVPDEGSVFTIKLPAVVSEIMPEASAEGVSSNDDGAPGEGSDQATPDASCILVIDDDPAQRELMERFLNKEGFCVRTAAGGVEGLRLARQWRPVAITLDVMMPDMDGWSVLEALKADANLQDIPVIMVTMVDDQNRGYALGASDYATKPVDRQRLSQILSKHTCPHPPCPVLLIEDDALTRSMMRAMLEKEGWVVTEAENGRSALESIAQNRPTLILLDLMMPEMDGFEFAAEMHRHPEWRSIPIVVLTARDLTDADRLRLNGYVQKILLKEGQPREEILQQMRDLVIGCVPSPRR